MAIIAFLGKGGSGKSTLSHAFTRFLESGGNFVLAIDADHNMDLAYNLGAPLPLPNYLGTSLGDLLEYAQLKPSSHYSQIVTERSDLEFTLSPKDEFTKKYTTALESNLLLMASGPHTNEVLYGKSCSHSLSTALKVYLPFLELRENQFVVIDEKAGSDGAGTGIASGFSFALICAEPTPHGIKAAHQIAELLEFYATPYEFVLNKIEADQDITSLLSQFSKQPKYIFKYSDTLRKNETISEESKNTFETIVKNIKEYLTAHGDTRKERSISKFLKSKDYLAAIDP